jgi:hypothetical protein
MALALGARAAGLARATVVRPVTVTAAGMGRLGGRVLPSASRHPRVADLATRGERIRERREGGATETIRGLLRRAVEAAVPAVDLTELVLVHVDLDTLAAGIDLDRIASPLDLDPIMHRVDPDAIVARVDVDAVIGRVDLAELAREVLAAIDLPEILRESTGAVSSQAPRAVRTEGMNADESVSRFVDRVLRRPHPRAAVTP